MLVGPLNVVVAGAYVKLPEYFRTHIHDDLKKSPFAYALGLEGMTYYKAIDQMLLAV